MLENKNTLSFAVFLTALALVGGIYFFATRTQVTPPDTIPVVEELKIEDLVVGTGAGAVSGKKITVNYTGTLTDGTKFDSSLNPGRTPFEFNLGAGEVIKGWDQGFTGMKVGGKRKLTIPPSLAYGDKTLIFDVELLKVE